MTKPYYEGPLLSLDTETTGVNPFEARIVTCNMTYHLLEEEPKIYDWLINPGVDIPEGATEVHGITNEIAQQHGMPPEVGLKNIAEHLTAWADYGFPVVVYNAAFDLTLLLNEFRRFGINYDRGFNTVIDPFVLDKALDKYRKGKRQLTLVAAHYGIKLANAHTADADSMASVLVARAIGKKYKLNMPVEEIHEKQKEFKKEQSESLQEYFRKSKNDPTIVINSDWPVQLTDTGS